MWSQFIRDNFDKLLLFVVLLVCLCAAMHLMGGQDAANSAWGREITGTVLGALIGIITGHAMGNGGRIPPSKTPDDEK